MSEREEQLGAILDPETPDTAMTLTLLNTLTGTGYIDLGQMDVFLAAQGRPDNVMAVAHELVEHIPQGWQLVSDDEVLGRAMLLGIPQKHLSTEQAEKAMAAAEAAITEPLKRELVTAYQDHCGCLGSPPEIIRDET